MKGQPVGKAPEESEEQDSQRECGPEKSLQGSGEWEAVHSEEGSRIVGCRWRHENLRPFP